MSGSSRSSPACRAEAATATARRGEPPSGVRVDAREREPWRRGISVLFVLAAIAAAPRHASTQDIAPAIRERVVAAAGQAFGWKADDVLLQPSELQASAGGRFYRASNRAIPDAGVVHFAQGRDGAWIDGARDPDAAAEVLRQCGRDADADWWARVVTVFEAKAAGRLVAAYDKLSIGLIESAGGQYLAPRLSTVDGRARLEFFVIRHATQPYRVTAELACEGPLRLDVVPVT